jgi:hypothetical protein
MERLRHSVAIGLLLLLLLAGRVRAGGSLTTAGQALPQSAAAASQRPTSPAWMWQTARVDAPKLFREMGARSLALDAAGYPHIAYGEDSLYYAWQDGTAWHYDVVDAPTEMVGWDTSLALDTLGRPHISYCDLTRGDLKYAYYDGSFWHVEVVDSLGDVGHHTSLVLDTLGFPHISYYDQGNGDLKYARWDGSAWRIETVDSANDVGKYTSLALDSAGRPHISYCLFDRVHLTCTDLKYAYHDGSTWMIQAVDSGGMGRYTSLVLDAQDRPRISYSEYQTYYPGNALRYAFYDGTAWQIETVDQGSVGWYSSLVLDMAGRPHIGYVGGAANVVKYAYFTGTAWLTETVQSLAELGGGTSLALDGAGEPRMSYCGQNGGFTHPEVCAELQYAWHEGVTWHIETVDRSGAAGRGSSLALDAAGWPHTDLAVARWDGWTWQIETVDNEGGVGANSSIALDASGRPHISYLDWYKGDLKYAQAVPWPYHFYLPLVPHGSQAYPGRQAGRQSPW